MEDPNIRILPRVCHVCKDFIFASDGEKLFDYDRKKSDIVDISKKCRERKIINSF